MGTTCYTSKAFLIMNIYIVGVLFISKLSISQIDLRLLPKMSYDIGFKILI